jgi:hypothetical protein
MAREMIIRKLRIVDEGEKQVSAIEAGTFFTSVVTTEKLPSLLHFSFSFSLRRQSASSWRPERIMREYIPCKTLPDSEYAMKLLYM